MRASPRLGKHERADAETAQATMIATLNPKLRASSAAVSPPGVHEARHALRHRHP